MKKKTFSSVLLTLMIIFGMGLLLYPTASDYINSLAYRRAISNYQRSVEELDEVTYEDLLASARDYNQRLAARKRSLLTLDESWMEEYLSLLDFTGTGIMGYIDIPKVNISLPIYHGTSDSVLQAGVGHLEGSSLPVGGESTHTVISAHTGLPSAKLFTDIDRLVEGDTFAIHVLRDVLTYEVDQILVVLPHQNGSLRIEPGEDLCTLMTCTPYGVNTHRLLVRGHRIPTPEEAESGQQSQSGISREGAKTDIVLVAMMLALAVSVTVRRVRGKRKKHGGPAA